MLRGVFNIYYQGSFKKIVLFFLFFIILSCKQTTEQLPYLGNHAKKELEEGNREQKYFKIPDFQLINQDSILITNQAFDNKIYIADFIFLKCPTICPKMNIELKRVYDIYKDNSEILFASHTIDPENDSITLLKAYSNQLGIDSKKWYFLHGEREYMHNLAENGYFSQAYQDQNVPGGYAHSGGFILVDKRKHIRGVYDGTDSDDVNRLIKEIAILLNEKLE